MLWMTKDFGLFVFIDILSDVPNEWKTDDFNSLIINLSKIQNNEED